MSQFVLKSPTKLNLTLRVLGRRPDGLHDICSVFFRLPFCEILTISPVFADSSPEDRLHVHGERIAGRNILLDVLSKARTKGIRVPRLEMNLWKTIPAGSGLGAGSGNAAALLRWIGRNREAQFHDEEVAALGADVPFLYGRETLSIRGGIGENVLEHDISFRAPGVVLVVIPDFQSNTSRAYGLFDNNANICSPPRLEDALSESRDVIRSIEDGERPGLLPNDFTGILLGDNPEYEAAFKAFAFCDAACWGITGSGSGCFALFHDPGAAHKAALTVSSLPGIGKILIME